MLFEWPLKEGAGRVEHSECKGILEFPMRLWVKKVVPKKSFGKRKNDQKP